MGGSTLFIPHGGGPLPLLGDDGHAALVDFLVAFPETLPRPRAIVVISAHWEEDVPTITSGRRPALIYDYFAFPPSHTRSNTRRPVNRTLPGRFSNC